jgi:glycine/D-amino acid oxidase-like deaminating enzyme/nitrite reductase/ring-hydroxylating ferredoxin subunit
MNRDGACTSIWQTIATEYQSTILAGHREYDVLVVGAGITGVTTALLLQHAGKSCILVEAANAGFGTTGGTTAHLNTFYDTPYQTMIKDFGEENAKLIAQGARTAIGLIKSNITNYNIECDFEEKDAYLFAENEDQIKDLEEIVEAANKLEVHMDFAGNMPYPFPHVKVARIPGQAQFHPIKYLDALLRAFTEAGGTFIENCRVTKIKEGELLEVETSLGIIKARNSIYATHIPPGVNVLHFRNAPYRSYALGIKLQHEDYPSALAYDMQDPYHYYRTQEIDGQHYLIAGGEDHKTGHEENTEASFRRLESHVRTYFRVDEVAFRWSSQYYEPADGLPYIGRLPGHGENMFVATGYSGNGMIYGTLAGLILSNLLVNGASIYEKLLSPSRIKPVAGFTNFVKEGADVVKELVKAVFPAEKLKELADLATGEAKVVKYEGNVMGLYKDQYGELHAVNSSCPHINCSVGWNAAEKTWDCPCHGSRFGFDGKLLTAPAVDDLQKIDLDGTNSEEDFRDL